jgi:hypothetical protein
MINSLPKENIENTSIQNTALTKTLDKERRIYIIIGLFFLFFILSTLGQCVLLLQDIDKNLVATYNSTTVIDQYIQNIDKNLVTTCNNTAVINQSIEQTNLLSIASIQTLNTVIQQVITVTD